MEPCVCVISKIYSMYCCSHTDVCTLKCTFLAIIICPWISEFSLNKMSVKKFRYRYFSCIRKSYPIFRYIRCHICIYHSLEMSRCPTVPFSKYARHTQITDYVMKIQYTGRVNSLINFTFSKFLLHSWTFFFIFSEMI